MGTLGYSFRLSYIFFRLFRPIFRGPCIGFNDDSDLRGIGSIWVLFEDILGLDTPYLANSFGVRLYYRTSRTVFTNFHSFFYFFGDLNLTANKFILYFRRISVHYAGKKLKINLIYSIKFNFKKILSYSNRGEVLKYWKNDILLNNLGDLQLC